MIILGIDPGLALMGYGVIEFDRGRYRPLTYGVISTAARAPMPQRLRTIYTGLKELISIYKPDDIAFEELFFYHNVTTGIAVAQARGVILLSAVQKQVKISEYTPAFTPVSSQSMVATPSMPEGAKLAENTK